VLTISTGYDPRYLTRSVATGRENYYLSAVAEHGEPPGIWTGAGCRELGLVIGSEVDAAVMERLYGAFLTLGTLSARRRSGGRRAGLAGWTTRSRAGSRPRWPPSRTRYPSAGMS
jgi:hypothetical protein